MTRRFAVCLAAVLVVLAPALLRADPPAAPALVAPTGTGISTTPSYTWNAVAGAEEFYLWVNNSAGVPVVQSWHPAASVCAGATCSVTPAAPLARGFCTWWIQARNGSGTGPWSAGMGFTVGSAPAAPTLVAPSGAGIAATPIYTWSAVADTDEYSLWVNNAAGAPVVQTTFTAVAACAGATCSATPSVSLAAGFHTWWVRGRNGSGDGPWSAGVGFTVGALPGQASLIGPSGVGASSAPTYTWNAVAGATDFYLWVNDSAGTPVVQTWLSAAAVCSGGTCAATPATVLAPGFKTWWIQTRNASGDGPWSAGMTFTVGEPPGAATLVSPTGAGVGMNPTFTWNTVATAATDYQLWVNGPAGTPLMQTWYAAGAMCSAGTCAVAPSQSLPRGSHVWWIRARNASGDGVWSAGMSFTVGDLPGAPVPRSPSGPVATASPTYVWDPVPDTDEYYLWVNGPSGTPVVQLHYAAADICTASSCSVRPAAALGSGGHTWWVQAQNGSGDGPWSAGMSFTVVASGSVAAGVYSSFALTPQQSVWAWGANWSGQLGLGSTTDVSQPTLVEDLGDVVAVVAGGDHTAVLRSDGTVWVAGSNTEGQLGRVGADTEVFEPVPGLTGVVQIAAGDAHMLALRSDGTVAAWGYGGSGELGNGAYDSSFTPITIPGLSSVVAVSAGAEHSLALKADGTVVAWGANYNGQLGDGTTEPSSTPVFVLGLPPITRIATGSSALHSFAVASDGSVYSWGANDYGQLGDGSTEARTVPVLVAGLTGVTHVAAGGAHSLAVRQDGSLYVWGSNESGQLGIAGASQQATPAQLESPTGITGIAAGILHTLVVTSDGRVLSWGDNGIAQLGTGEAGAFVSTPIELSAPGFQWQTLAPAITPPGGTLTSEQDATIACLMPGATIRYTTDGSEPTEASPIIDTGGVFHVDGSLTIRARAWKDGFAPSPIAAASFVLETASPIANPPAGSYAGLVQVSLASQTPNAEIRYTTDGSEPMPASLLYSGPVTLTTTTTMKARAFYGTWSPSAVVAYTFTVSPAGAVAAGQAFSVALDPTGAVWAWGAGEAGQLGNGLGADSAEALPVEAVTDAVAIAAGGTHALALRADGTVVAWGDDQLSPVAVAGLDSVIAVAAGGTHSLALRSDGHVYSWGTNSFGQLGDGTTDDHALPAIVPSLTNITAIAAGEAHSVALTADGRVFAWGDNGFGQVGDGSGSAQPTPVEVLTDAVSVGAGAHHSFAVKNDASGWAWGRNDNGQLSTDGGDSTLPTLVMQGSCDGEGGCDFSPFNDVRRFAGGAVHSLALTGDGRLWSAGGDYQGQLGRWTWSDLLAVIDSLSDIVAFAAGGQHSLAITATGEVWAWGGNGKGQLGDGTTDSRPTPVQVVPAGFAWRLPRPIVSPAPGTYTSALDVTITSPVVGAVVRYTIDGVEPTEASPAVTGLIRVETSTALKARAFKAGWAPSQTAGGSYNLNFGTLDPPAADPPGGHFVTQVEVTLTAAAGATVSVMLCDGAGANCSAWAPYVGSFVVDRTTTVFARASSPDWSTSATVGATYVVHVATPVVTPGGGTYGSDHLITVTNPTPAAQLHYTTNGLDPTQLDPTIASGATLAMGSFRLKIKAWKNGAVPSGVVTRDFLLSTDPNADSDQDGLTLSQEAVYGTDPSNADTNGDGVPDGAAVALGISPTSLDVDGDGVTNSNERSAGTNPLRLDTDGDGTSDGTDCFPLDSTQSTCLVPTAGDVTPPLITLLEPPNAILVSSNP